MEEDFPNSSLKLESEEQSIVMDIEKETQPEFMEEVINNSIEVVSNDSDVVIEIFENDFLDVARDLTEDQAESNKDEIISPREVSEPASVILAIFRLGSVMIFDNQSIHRLNDAGYGVPTSKYQADNTSDEMIEYEFMTLFEEEALYLLFHKLIRVTKDSEVIDFQQLWQILIQKVPALPLKYKVYEHFKNKQFIVKSGLNFGMDYSVYRNLPRYCHSEFCIKIMHSFERVEKDLKSIDKKFNYIHTTKENFTWKELSALTRVMPDVMKICVLCYVQPVEENSSSSSSSKSPYSHLFENESTQEYNFEDSSIINSFSIHLVTSLVRRLPVNNMKYPTIQRIHRKYQQSSALRIPRKRVFSSKSTSHNNQGTTFKNSNNYNSNNNNQKTSGNHSKNKTSKFKRQRRDVSEIRVKGKMTKTNKIWTTLLVKEPSETQTSDSQLKNNSNE